MSRGKLIVVTGPTASGKTDYSIDLALRVGSPVISCDSRQIYKEMTIGTAVPDASQLSAVKHYFIQTVPVTELYTAGRYEAEALALVNKLFAEGHETLVMCGGSGFYVDAVVNGLDDLPDGDPALRAELLYRMETEGLDSLRMDLRRLDPEAYATIDIANGRRVVRALEVCLISGRPFSSFKKNVSAGTRDFDIEKYCISRPRDVLYDRINRRVVKMMDDGLLEEARSLIGYRDLSALQTVGYKELFNHFDGKISLDEAVSQIQHNTRKYAKKQITWWKRDPAVRYVNL